MGKSKTDKSERLAQIKEEMIPKIVKVLKDSAKKNMELASELGLPLGSMVNGILYLTSVEDGLTVKVITDSAVFQAKATVFSERVSLLKDAKANPENFIDPEFLPWALTYDVNEKEERLKRAVEREAIVDRQRALRVKISALQKEYDELNCKFETLNY